MSTDRELLELAAKAAGIKIDKSPFNGGGYGNTGFDLDGNAVIDWHNGITWNPITDDGDALRLAVRLKINVFLGEAGYATAGRHGIGGHRVPIFDDDDAATRRAIVRAAADIGGVL